PAGQYTALGRLLSHPVETNLFAEQGPSTHGRRTRSPFPSESDHFESAADGTLTLQPMSSVRHARMLAQSSEQRRPLQPCCGYSGEAPGASHSQVATRDDLSGIDRACCASQAAGQTDLSAGLTTIQAAASAGIRHTTSATPLTVSQSFLQLFACLG